MRKIIEKSKEKAIQEVFEKLGINDDNLSDYKNIDEFTKQIERCTSPKEDSYVYITFSLNEKRNY